MCFVYPRICDGKIEDFLTILVHVCMSPNESIEAPLLIEPYVLHINMFLDDPHHNADTPLLTTTTLITRTLITTQTPPSSPQRNCPLPGRALRRTAHGWLGSLSVDGSAHGP
jgi:hypothetical protein